MAEVDKKIKSKRRSNWETNEKHFLIELVSEYIEVLEKKKNDFESNSAKISAWKEVWKKFSARYGERRELKELKEQWKRLKIAAKSDWSRYSAGKKLTGGGSPPQEPSAVSSTIRSLVPQEFVQLHNPYDDDAAGDPRKNGEAVDPLTFLAGKTQDSTLMGFDIEPCEASEAAEVGEGSGEVTIFSVIHEPASAPTAPVPSLTSAQPHMTSGSLDFWTPSKKARASTSSPAPTSKASCSLQDTLKEHTKKEHDAKMAYLEEEHLMKMEVLQLKKQVQMKKLNKLNFSEDC